MHHQRLACLSGDGHVEGRGVSGLNPPSVGLAETLVQVRVIGFPDPIPHLQATGVEMAVAEVMAVLPDLVDPASLLLIGIGAGVKDDAVAGLERGQRVEGDEVGAHSRDGSQEGPSLLAEAGVDEFLMIHPVHPAGVKPAGEGHLELVAILVAGFAGLACQGGVDGFPVNLADGGHILGGLQASLDLETFDARGDQVRNVVHRREVLRGEQVALVTQIAERPVHDKFVRHPAGLGAFAAVGTPLAERLARQALAGVGDAERAVDKDLERHPLLVEALEFPQREFAGQDRAGDPEIAGHLDTLRRGEGHLGRGVDGKFRNDRGRQTHQTDVLNDQRIDAGTVQEAQVLRRVIEFSGEDKGIERHVGLHPVAVAEGGDLGKLLLGEIIGAQSGIEAGQAEEHRIGAIGNRRLQAIPPPGRG